MMNQMKGTGVGQIVTIGDVARAAGVSTSTVSCALSGKNRVSAETRETVKTLAREMGYEPNPHAQRLLFGRAEKHIDIVSVCMDWGMGARKAQSIQSLLIGRGYSAPIHAYGGRTAACDGGLELVSTLRRQRPRAIVLDDLVVSREALAELNRFEKEGGIVVCYGYGLERKPLFDCVLFSAEHSLFLDVEHLAGLGHRDIGFYRPSATQHDPKTNARFGKLLESHGLTFREEWCFPPSNWVSASPDPDEIAELMARQFLSLSPRPMGLIIQNDYAALTFISELWHHGIQVPEDLSVIGHDDRPMGRRARVPLTSVTHPAEEMASTVVELLCDRLDGQYLGEPRVRIVRGELQVRQTTAPPRAVNSAISHL